jgi:hypothetical protein
MPLIASPVAGQRFAWTIFWNSGAFSTGANRPTGEQNMRKKNIAALSRRIMPQLSANTGHDRILFDI